MLSAKKPEKDILLPVAELNQSLIENYARMIAALGNGPKKRIALKRFSQWVQLSEHDLIKSARAQRPFFFVRKTFKGPVLVFTNRPYNFRGDIINPSSGNPAKTEQQVLDRLSKVGPESLARYLARRIRNAFVGAVLLHYALLGGQEGAKQLVRIKSERERVFISNELGQLDLAVTLGEIHPQKAEPIIRQKEAKMRLLVDEMVKQNDLIQQAHKKAELPAWVLGAVGGALVVRRRKIVPTLSKFSTKPKKTIFTGRRT